MYLYDYDSLGRLIRQEIQTNDTFSHVGSTEVTYDVRNNVTKVASEFGGYTATDEYMYSSSSGAADAAQKTDMKPGSQAYSPEMRKSLVRAVLSYISDHPAPRSESFRTFMILSSVIQPPLIL